MVTVLAHSRTEFGITNELACRIAKAGDVTRRNEKPVHPIPSQVERPILALPIEMNYCFARDCRGACFVEAVRAPVKRES